MMIFTSNKQPQPRFIKEHSKINSPINVDGARYVAKDYLKLCLGLAKSSRRYAITMTTLTAHTKR